MWWSVVLLSVALAAGEEESSGSSPLPEPEAQLLVTEAPPTSPPPTSPPVTSPPPSEAPVTLPEATTPTAAVFNPEVTMVGTTEPKKWEVKYSPNEGAEDVKTPEEANWDGPAQPDEKVEEVVVVKSQKDAPSGPFTCFDCVSAMDEKCLDEHWDLDYAQNNFRKICAAHRPETMTDAVVKGCRKTYTTMPDGTRRTARACAYSGPSIQGHKKAGSEGLIRFFYQCASADCNSGVGLAGSLALLLAALLL